LRSSPRHLAAAGCLRRPAILPSSSTASPNVSTVPRSIHQHHLHRNRSWQDLRFNLTPTGRPRITVYELSVSRDPRANSEMSSVDRTLQLVNGRPARKNQQPGCTDPKTGSPEPLAFLLAVNQRRYRFTLADDGAGGPAGTRAIDFIETPPERVRVKWDGNCFAADGGGYQGRVWFDPISYDVMQVALRLSKPFRIPLRPGYIGLEPAIRVERSEMTIRFSRVEFQQPDEVVLLPESIETLTPCFAEW
jgi:hypothetical protein